MACRGVFLSLTCDHVAGLVGIRTDRELLEAVLAVMEELAEEHRQPCDKSWDAMHRCLSDGGLDPEAGTYPLNRCVLGGVQLYHDIDYIISFVPPEEVADVAVALAPVTKPWMRERYFALREYDGPQDENDFEYTWAYFEDVRRFYTQAATEKRAVVFFVDQ